MDGLTPAALCAVSTDTDTSSPDLGREPARGWTGSGARALGAACFAFRGLAGQRSPAQGSAFFWAREVETFEVVDQGAAGDAEQLGGPGLVSGALVQGL